MEIMRRLRLAFQKIDYPTQRPAPRHYFGELGYIFEPVRRRFYHLDITPHAHPHTIMLLPGFATHPARMEFMAKQLARAGHSVHDWGLGFNWGPNAENIDFLERRLRGIHESESCQITLVGWSLGGLFARELAHRIPDKIAKVITMGSPFADDPRGNNVWRLYQAIAGHKVDELPIETRFRTKPPVETIALWSRRDGLVSAACAHGTPDSRDRAVEVDCTHMGFSGSQAAILAVMREL